MNSEKYERRDVELAIREHAEHLLGNLVAVGEGKLLDALEVHAVGEDVLAEITPQVVVALAADA